MGTGDDGYAGGDEVAGKGKGHCGCVAECTCGQDTHLRAVEGPGGRVLRYLDSDCYDSRGNWKGKAHEGRHAQGQAEGSV